MIPNIETSSAPSNYYPDAVAFKNASKMLNSSVARYLYKESQVCTILEFYLKSPITICYSETHFVTLKRNNKYINKWFNPNSFLKQGQECKRKVEALQAFYLVKNCTVVQMNIGLIFSICF